MARAKQVKKQSTTSAGTEASAAESAETNKVVTKPTHPPTAQMVIAAITHMKELGGRGGSSLQAIKKYIAINYEVDVVRMAPFIRNYLKSAVATGKLVQTKGTGASGSFKIAPKEFLAPKKQVKKSAPKKESVKKTAPVAPKTPLRKNVRFAKKSFTPVMKKASAKKLAKKVAQE
ncbi:histone H1A, sperm-like [Neocloeon triangulifer]|uniref:histone H1A, sperm-like n=1 Tax=Neocloeon triangulifer TaxID=2078957 RepID=UPI00286F5E8F|nr:histone H1A, sperm-like [Neocloeon triangulifer]